MAGIRGFTGWVGTVIGTQDPVGLAHFWAGVIGGTVDERDGTFATVHREGTYYLACQLETEHRPPVWPASVEGDQQMQLHLDIGVASLAEAVADAEALGARLADHQPQDDVRVL